MSNSKLRKSKLRFLIMRELCCYVYLSMLISGNIMVQSIQEEIFTNFVNTFTENEVRIMNKLKNTTRKHSTSKWQHQGNFTNHQGFPNAFKTKLKLAKNSTKVVVTSVEVNHDRARQYNLSRDWDHENLQKRQVATDEEVETDDTIYMTFSEKERKDGYKRTRAEDNPYAVLVAATIQDIGGKAMICGGTLVTPLAVLTAAHCFDHNVGPVHLYAGCDSLRDMQNLKRLPKAAQFRETSVYYLHPSYSKKSKIKYDVAVVKVTKPFEMTSTVKTLKIGERPWTHEGYKACTLTAFGKVYSNKPHLEDNTRKTHYLEVIRPCPCLESTDGTLLCSRLREDYGACPGDSGGGLVCDGVVVAVACAVAEFKDVQNCIFTPCVHCALNNTMTLFQETGPYLEWINSTVNVAKSSSSGSSCPLVLIVLLVTTLYYMT